MHSPIQTLPLLLLPFLACCGGLPPSDPVCGDHCDATQPPDLQALSLDSVVECALIPTQGDPFFSVDQVLCTLSPLPSNETVGISAVSLDVVQEDGRILGSTYLSGDEIDEQPIILAEFYADSYPITVRATIHYWVYEWLGIAGQEAQRESVFHAGHGKAEVSEAKSLISLTPPFDLWEVGIWPSAELVAGSPTVIESITYEFPVESDALNVGGVSPTEEFSFRRQLVYPSPSFPYRPHLLHLLVPKEGFATFPSLSIRVNRVEPSSPISGPGYYVVSHNGNAVLTQPADLPNYGGHSADAGSVEADADVVLTDPCNGMCSNEEACVQATCRPRNEQTQATSCQTPIRVCDFGENNDCANDHACVGGLCRRLECQTQPIDCYPPNHPCDGDDNTDCANDHACVGGLCRRLECQTQPIDCYLPSHPCDGDDNSDCADDHACVGGLCRRLECQTQPIDCYPPNQPCDGDDNSDCAAGHSCQQYVCKRDTCTV